MSSDPDLTGRSNPWGGFTPQLQPSPQVTREQRVQQLLIDGLAHHQAGRLSPARQCYEQALMLMPGQADALNLLGVVAAQENRRDDAVELLTRAAAARPKDADILNNLGRFLLEAGRFGDARDPLERAVALQPDDVNARYNLAGALRQLGEPQHALELWAQVLAADPELHAARIGTIEVLSEQGRFDEAERMARETIAAHPQLSPVYLSLARIRRFDADDGTLDLIERRIAQTPHEIDEAILRYAAGKVCDDLGLYDRAFVHFDMANRLAHGDYDHAAVLARRRAQTAVFTEDVFRERRGWGFDSEVPVFIVGMPCSGASLVEQVLAAHPEVFGAGEITTLERLARVSAEITPGEDPYPLNVPRLRRFGAELIGRRYVSALTGRADGPARRITDTTPRNFEELGLIALVLPKAKIIHCRRDPLDACVSSWTTAFSDARAYSRAFEDIGRHYRSYVELMDHWRSVLPVPILDVDYEALVREPEVVARRMVEFIGQGWSPQVLKFHKHADAIGRWRNYAAHVGPLRQALGDLAKD